MRVLGVSGQMQNGKDTVADYLATKLNPIDGEPWVRKAFAAEVKRVFCDNFGVDLYFVEKWKVIPEPPPGFDMTVRQALQFIGDGFRKIQGNIWVEKPFRNETRPLIISDVRYINEIDKIRTLDGITILVWRPGHENEDPNGSEAQIRPVMKWFSDLYERDGEDGAVIERLITQSQCCAEIPHNCLKVDLFLANNGSVDDLFEKVDRVVLPFIKEKWKEVVCGS